MKHRALPVLSALLLLGSGVSIKAGNNVICAVGAGGAPSGNLNEQCAMAALEKITVNKRGIKQ